MKTKRKPGSISQEDRDAVDILELFRRTGWRWQTRMSEGLRDWLREHPTA